MNATDTSLDEVTTIIAVTDSIVEKTRICEQCGAKEGEPHPMRGFEVTLQPINNDNADSPLVCLICKLDKIKKDARDINEKKSQSLILKRNRLVIGLILIGILIITGVVLF